MPTLLSSLLMPYGYIFVFLLILLESAGLPLPGETLLVLAAGYAASGKLSILGVILSAALGAILGDMGGYWIGRRGGNALLKRISGRRYEEHITKGHIFFDRYGAGAVFLARFVPVVRVVGANLAGMTKMPFSIFTVFNSIGGFTWAITMGSLGYFFGNNLPYLDSLLHKLGVGLVTSIGLLATVIWINRRIASHELEARTWLDHLQQRLGLQKIRIWLTHGFHSNQRLVFVLGGGLLLAAFSGWMFGTLAEDVLARDSVTLYDVTVGRWVLNLATEDSSEFFFTLTLLGSAWVILPAGLLLGSWLVWRKQRLYLAALVLSVGGGSLLNLVLKNIFLRPRPNFANAFYIESGYSFPSGHAMLSVLFYGMAAYLLARSLTWKGQVQLGVTAFTLSLLIGFSRIFLGVHYLTDVLGGWAAGVVWLTTCVATVESIQLLRSNPVNLSNFSSQPRSG